MPSSRQTDPTVLARSERYLNTSIEGVEASCLSSAPAQGSCCPAKHSAGSSTSAAAQYGASRGATRSTSNNISPSAASAARRRLVDYLLLGFRNSSHGGGLSGLFLHLRSCSRFSGLLLGLSSSVYRKGSFS